MAITIKTIDQILDGTIADTSPIMFGTGTDIFKTTWGALKSEITGGFVNDLSYQLITDNSIVDINQGNTFLNTRDANIPKGQLTFIQFKVIYEDSSLGLNTYLIPLGEGNYSPLGGSVAFNELFLINRESTTLESTDTNTTTYSFTDLDELNVSDPSIDLTDTNKVYFISLSGTLFHFVGANGLYGINDLQMSLDDLNIVRTSGEQPTGLEAIDEGNGIGFRLIGRDPRNYGNIGKDAVDLSFNDVISTTRGATGNNSHAEGLETTAIGINSHAEGDRTAAAGSISHAQGRLTIANGFISHAEGDGTEASGLSSHAEGVFTFARGQAEHSGGRFGTDYTPTNDGRDRLFNIGNGTNSSSRSDAFTIYRNGAVKFFRATISSITNAVKEGMLIFNSDDNNRPTIHNGTDWKGLAYKDDDVILTSPNNTQYKLKVDDSGNLSTEIV